MLIIFFLISLVQADFTPHFRAYLHNNYGIGIAQMLERSDLGLDASFGGKLNGSEELTNQAVILVHGITNKISRFEVSLLVLIPFQC